MKNYITILFICVFGLLSSCKSEESEFQKQEKELGALLNNEWEAMECNYLVAKFIRPGYPIPLEKLDEMFDADTDPIRYHRQTVTIGMNKKGGFYLWFEKFNQYNWSMPTSIDRLIYICTNQQGNKFSGKLNVIGIGRMPYAVDSDFYIRKIDENTIKMLLINPMTSDYDGSVALFILNKKGPWNEENSLKSILEGFDIEAGFIQAIGGENFERDVAQGRCK